MIMEPARALALVTSSYYRGVPSDVVVVALEHVLLTQENAGWPQDERFANIVYLFCRIAQLSPDVRRAVATKKASLSGRAADLVRKILAAVDSPTFPNALDQQVISPGHLDQLWAEFFVTGSREPLLRIVSILDAPDGIRRLLDAWLQEQTWFGARKRAAVAETLRAVGLVLDLKSRSIVTAGDLDCFCFSLAERQVPIFKLLPCRLAPDDVLNLSVKGGALWSMRLNSREHDLVRAVCHEEHARPGGAGRVRLVEPIPDQKPFAL